MRDRRPQKILVLGALLLLVLSQPPPVARASTSVLSGSFSGMMLDPARPRLYLMNSSGGSIAVLNTTSDKEVANVWVGPGPSGMDISADGRELFVAVSGGGYLAVVNLTSLAVEGDIPLPAKPIDVAAGRLGRAYVTTSASRLLVVDTNSSSVIDSVSSWSSLARISPDREVLYVGLKGLDPSSISKFSVATDNVALISTVPFGSIGYNLEDFAVSPDGSRLYVASASPYYVQVINSSDWSPIGVLHTGAYPIAVSLDASGGLALASYSPYGGVRLYNTTTFLAVRTYRSESTSLEASFVALSSDGSRAYVVVGDHPMQLELVDTSEPGTGLLGPTFISLYPSLGAAGTSVAVAGLDFVPSHNLTVSFDGSTAGMPTNCTSDASGNVSYGCAFTVPPSAFGSHTVTVSDGTNSPTAVFTVPTPSIALFLPSGAAGSPVEITGIGLVPSHNLTVAYDGSTAGMPTNCTTNARGGINPGCTFTVPPSAFGSHTVTVSDGTNSPTAVFTVPTPLILLSPSSGAPGSPVEITGIGLVPSRNLTVAYDGSTAGMPTNCTTNAWGDIDYCAFTVPPSTIGYHTVTVSDGTSSPTATFLVPLMPPAVTIPGTITVGSFPCAAAVDPATNRIYVVNSGSGTVSVINGKTNLVTRTIGVGLDPNAAAVDPATNRIYVVNSGSGTVSVINGKTNLVIANVGVGYGSSAVAVDPKTNTVYVAKSGDNTVSVINGRTNLVTDTIGVGDDPLAVAVDPATNRIYVANYGDGTVSVINGRTNLVTQTVGVGEHPFALAVDPKTNTVYVANFYSAEVSVINGTTNLVVAKIYVGEYPIAVAVNPATDTAYAVNLWSNTVSVIDGKANVVTRTIGVGYVPLALAVNPKTDTVYVANDQNDTVSVIGRRANEVIQTIDVGYFPSAAAVNTATNRIYVVNTADDNVSVINGKTNLVIGNISVGYSPSAVAVNPSTDRIYVTDAYDNNVSVINGKTNLVIANVSVESDPSAVAVNTATNRIYVANAGEDTISVINGKTNLVIANVSVGYSPFAVAVNTATNRIYVANAADDNVSVINGKTNLVIANVSVGYSPSAVAVDSKTDTIYVANSNNTVSVINGKTNLVTRTIGVGEGPSAIATNPTTDTVYVANFYDNTVSVINGRTNLVTETIGVGNSPSAVAVDAKTNSVYVANSYDNTVSVVAPVLLW